MKTHKNPKVRAYSDKVPGEIKRAISGLDGELQWAILVLLMKKEGLAFSELQDELSIHQQKLTNALDDLQDGSVIERIDLEDHTNRYAAKYVVTDFGIRIFDGLFDSLETKKDPMDVWTTSETRNIAEQDAMDTAFSVREQVLDA